MAIYPYQKMKNAELRRLCAEKGVDIDIDSAKRLDLVQALRQHDAEVGEEMSEQAEMQAASQPASRKKQDDSGKPSMKGKVKLMVPNTNGERASNRPLFVGCNGRSWFIPLEQPVIVPKEVKNVLDLAIRRVTQSTDDGHFIERDARRVPFQVLEEGPD